MENRFNTIAGWALFSGIVALGLSSLSSKYFKADKPHAPETPGYVVEGVVSSEGGAAEVPIETFLANADLAKGEAVFKKCVACHTINQGGAHGIGRVDLERHLAIRKPVEPRAAEREVEVADLVRGLDPDRLLRQCRHESARRAPLGERAVAGAVALGVGRVHRDRVLDPLRPVVVGREPPAQFTRMSIGPSSLPASAATRARSAG